MPFLFFIPSSARPLLPLTIRACEFLHWRDAYSRTTQMADSRRGLGVHKSDRVFLRSIFGRLFVQISSFLGPGRMSFSEFGNPQTMPLEINEKNRNGMRKKHRNNGKAIDRMRVKRRMRNGKANNGMRKLRKSVRNLMERIRETVS